MIYPRAKEYDKSCKEGEWVLVKAWRESLSSCNVELIGLEIL